MGGSIASALRSPLSGFPALDARLPLPRHHEVTGERLRRILAEPEPALPRYRAEEDPDWPRWVAVPLAEIVERLRALRAGLIGAVAAIPPADLDRRGVHPVLGPMAIPLWLEFFLLHEAHHLYATMLLLRTPPAT